jgi:F-type H+-transporting ATPase subunit alpha
MTIDKGKKNEQLLIQPLHQPMSVEKQVAVLYCGTEGLLRDIPVGKVSEFEKQFLFTLDVNHKETVLDRLKNSEFNDEITAILRKVAADTVKQLQN